MAALQLQITRTGALLDQLAQTYDAATTQLTTLHQQEASTQAAIAAARAKLAVARRRLQVEAVLAYIDDIPATSTTSLFSMSTVTAAASEYQRVAIGDTAAAASAFETDEQALAAKEAAFEATETAVRADLSQITSARQAAMVAAATQAASLAAVSVGDTAVSPGYLAAQSTGRDAVVADRTAPPLPHAFVAAIWAAASQLGVPYVWGGETPVPDPAAGFDCSGLVQWAYGQAGIVLPRTAQAQYAAVTPVPAGDAQPGDLVFWDDGTTAVQHVAIYVGAGTVLQAPSTGSVVSYAPLWSDGLVGFGVPAVPAG